jgi:hypothetical protein
MDEGRTYLVVRTWTDGCCIVIDGRTDGGEDKFGEEKTHNALGGGIFIQEN